MSTLTLELTESLAARLESASAARHIAPEKLVCETLEHALPGETLPNGNGATLYELMRDAIGSVSSGIGDLASNPKHLEGYGLWRK